MRLLGIMRFANYLIIVSLVLASATFLAQPTQAQLPSTSDFTGQICITSYRDDCHAPLPNATVQLQGGGFAGLTEMDETTHSDEDGRFRFDDVPEGSYELTITRTGFQSMRQDVSVPDDDDGAYALQGKDVVATGTVRDKDGDPVGSASIQLWGEGGDAHAVSAQDGSFRIAVQAGMYELHVESKRHGSLGQSLLIDGSPIDIRLGALPGQDAVLQGRVTDQRGQPVQGAEVVIHQWQARERHHGARNVTQTDADGRYQAHLYSGHADVQFSKPGHERIYEWIEIDSDAPTVLDVQMLRYPDKTAQIQATVVDEDGEPLPHVSVNLYHPEYGIHECSTQSGGGSSHGHDTASSEPAASPAMSEPAHDDMYYAPRGCAITVDGGMFSGNVTPGYAILGVHYDLWAACHETRDADGSYRRDCGPDYFRFTKSVHLEADAETAWTIVLRQKPGPDAAISGYVVDGEEQAAIPGARVSFNNQESHAYGTASTDDDGSYRIRLRSGYHDVSVWADGYLPWQGVVFVDRGGEMPFDITLTPGETRYGHGCCYGHAEVAYDDMGSSDAPQEARASSSDGRSTDGESEMGGNPAMGQSDGGDYEDLGGGLGPYDPKARAELLDKPDGSKGIPMPWSVVIVGILGAVLIRRK